MTLSLRKSLYNVPGVSQTGRQQETAPSAPNPNTSAPPFGASGEWGGGPRLGFPKSGVLGRVDRGGSPTSREASPQPRPHPAPSPGRARRGRPPEKVRWPARPTRGPAPTLHSAAAHLASPPGPQVYTNKVWDSLRLLWPLSASARQDKGCPHPGGRPLRGCGRGLPSWGEEQRPPPYLGRESARSGPGRGGGEGAAGLGPLRCPTDGDLSARCGSGATPARHPRPHNPALGKGRLNHPSGTSGCRAGSRLIHGCQQCLCSVVGHPVSVIISVISVCFKKIPVRLMINNLSASRKCPPPCGNNTLKKKEKQRGTSFALDGGAAGVGVRERPSCLPQSAPPCPPSSPWPTPSLFLTGRHCDRKLAGYFFNEYICKGNANGFFPRVCNLSFLTFATQGICPGDKFTLEGCHLSPICPGIRYLCDPAAFSPTK